VEATDYYRSEPSTDAKVYIVGDRHYDGLRSPIDGADISTRAKHQAYMREKGLVTADDFKNEWAQAAKKREAFFKGEDPNRPKDIAKSFEKVTRGYKPLRPRNFTEE
jgi:hypothetical protein